MIGAFEIGREFGHALLNLLLGIPRHAWSLIRRRARLAHFASLQRDTALPPLTNAPPPTRLRRVVISCGDASGEAHARRLVTALRQRHPQLEVAGFGSVRMAEEGMRVWEPLADLNVMGFRDVFAQLPRFVRCVGRFVREIRSHPPDAVILIDYPGLNRHLLRVAARAGVPVIDYIAPQLWAWAPWRVRDFRRADRLLVILPFESDWYRQHGARPQWVGHPLGDGLAQSAAEEAALPEAIATADPTTQWVGLLPGSRGREIDDNLPLMLQAAEMLAARRPEIRFVLPHLRPDQVQRIRGHLANCTTSVVFAEGCFHRVLPHLQAAWVTSGTAVLELAAHRVPPVLVYAMHSRLGAWLAAHWLAVPWVGGLNLVAGREMAPEHLGRGLSATALADDLEARLDGPVRTAFEEQLEGLLPAFAASGPAERAALEIEACVAEQEKKPIWA